MMLFPPQEPGFTWNAVDKYVRVYASYDFRSGPAIGAGKMDFWVYWRRSAEYRRD
jgi:hypothetical protein